MDTLFIRHIKNALGAHIHSFEIRLDEVLNEDEDSYSCTFSFEPKQVEGREYKVTGEKHSLEFCVYDGDPCLIVGEDTDVEISFGNIYAQLYWLEATEAL